jgi:hypothetical protein
MGEEPVCCASCASTAAHSTHWPFPSLPSRARSSHSSRIHLLKPRIARTSACQSCKTFPFAWATFEAGRHFIPVASEAHVRVGADSVVSFASCSLRLWGVSESLGRLLLVPSCLVPKLRKAEL